MKISWIVELFVALVASVHGLLLDVPPRLQWGWEAGLSGYCGETSIQSAGLFFGNYISQEQVRYAGGNKEVLLDVNLHTAADNLGLAYDKWTPMQFNQTGMFGVGYARASSFPVWTKNHLDAQHPVIVGLFEKQPKGDADYDHIAPMIGYDMNKFVLYYNDLYLSTTRTMSLTDIKTRAACFQAEPPVQPFSYCFPTPINHGLAVTGNKNSLETYRVILKLWDAEEPDWGDEDKLHEKPIEFTPRAIISGLTTNKSYALLRFDSVESLPPTSVKFIDGSWSERIDFVANKGEHEVILGAIMSDGTYFFRCVEIRIL